MRRDDYILAVKTKLDEISPFDEPNDFIAAAGDTDYDEIKPIISYIDDCLDKAAWFCLNNLPLTLLSKDVSKSCVEANIDTKGIGRIGGIDEYWRLIRIHDNSDMWERDVTAFISMSDPLYLLQQNFHTRGGCAKPIVVYSPDTSELELYSFPSPCQCGEVAIPITLYYIDSHIRAEMVQSNIADFVVLVCASYVEEILGDTNAAKTFMEEYGTKLNTVLK